MTDDLSIVKHDWIAFKIINYENEIMKICLNCGHVYKDGSVIKPCSQGPYSEALPESPEDETPKETSD